MEGYFLKKIAGIAKYPEKAISYFNEIEKKKHDSLFSLLSFEGYYCIYFVY